MRKLIFIAIAILGLNGCVHQNYGNFTKLSPINNERIAADTALQVASLYPPATIHLVVSQPVTDDFGKSLVKELRSRGFALAEYSARINADKNSKPGEKEFHYILDSTNPDLIRISVIIGGETVSRAYLNHDNSVAPAGTWIRRQQ